MRKRLNFALILLFIGIVITFQVMGYINYPKHLAHFNEMELEGTITYLHSSSGGTKVSINHSEDKIILHTKYNYSIEYFFYKFAEVGDSIYKGQNDKYVHLFKDNQEYLFEVKE